MWFHNEKEYTSDDVVSNLADTDRGIVVLDGPSGCGKTTIIKTLQSTGAKIVSGEFASEVVRDFEKNIEDPVKIALRYLEGYDTVCLEDVDLHLKGRPATTSFIKQAITTLSSKCLVVLTGIDLLYRVPDLMSGLDMTHYSWNDKKQSVKV